MIVSTEKIKWQIKLANTPEKMDTLLHELFMKAPYGSTFQNTIGLASQVNQICLENNDLELFRHLRHDLLNSFKFPILFL